MRILESGKRHHLEVLLSLHKPHIFALTETKLISSTLDREICDGYTQYRRDRPNQGSGRGGGVLIGINDLCNIKVVDCFIDSTGELITTHLVVNGFSFHFVVYYRRPIVKNADDFIAWYQNQISSNLVIVGDFNLPNINWNNRTLKTCNDKSMHESFLNVIASSDLEQKVNFPTHKCSNTLDLLLSNLDVSTPSVSLPALTMT